MSITTIATTIILPFLFFNGFVCSTLSLDELSPSPKAPSPSPKASSPSPKAPSLQLSSHYFKIPTQDPSSLLSPIKRDEYNIKFIKSLFKNAVSVEVYNYFNDDDDDPFLHIKKEGKEVIHVNTYISNCRISYLILILTTDSNTLLYIKSCSNRKRIIPQLKFPTSPPNGDEEFNEFNDMSCEYVTELNDSKMFKPISTELNDISPKMVKLISSPVKSRLRLTPSPHFVFVDSELEGGSSKISREKNRPQSGHYIIFISFVLISLFSFLFHRYRKLKCKNENNNPC